MHVHLLSLCLGKHQILQNCSLSLRLNFIFEITNEIWQQLCHKCCFFWSNERTYGQVWWPILGISALHLTHPKCTHTVNTHPELWAAIYAEVPREQLGVRCLAQGHLSRGVEGGESAVHSLPLPTIRTKPGTRTSVVNGVIKSLYLRLDQPVHMRSSERWLFL